MKRRSRRYRNYETGMTLLEIMIVLALIGLITATIGRSILGRWKEGKKQTAQIQLRDLSSTIQQYLIARKGCPTIDDLVRENFLREVPIDPWGQPIVIYCPGHHDRDGVDLISFGPDQREDTDDDLKSWHL